MHVSTWFLRAVFQIIIFYLIHVRSKHQNSTETCLMLYEKGVEAYLESNYNECVLNFEKAIEKYRSYTKRLRNCRMSCNEEAENSELLYSIDLENLQFYEKTLRNTLCVLRCRFEDGQLFGIYNINAETENLFENRKPYEYLHICYYQASLNKAFV